MKHHFFLLRHCVRSAAYDDESLKVLHQTGTQPEWSVPKDWCVGKGAQHILQDTGKYIARKYLAKEDNLESIDIIADSSTRTILSAYALQKGLKSKLKRRNIRGLDEIQTSHSWLFDSVCEQEYDKSTIELELKRKLKETPKPNLNMRQAVHRIRDWVGWEPDYSKLSFQTRFVRNRWDFSGAALLLDDFAQLLFLSKSVGLDFCPNATVNQVYELLQLHDWRRSILFTNNTRAASKGAPMLAYLYNLWEEQQVLVTQSNTLPQSSRATIIMGHDSDLNYLATLLGATWELPAYQHTRTQQRNGVYLATPPGSGIHIELDLPDGGSLDDTTLSLEFLAPVYHKASKSHPSATASSGDEVWKASMSGTLYSSPVLLFSEKSMIVKDMTRIGYGDLKGHISSVLDRWPLARQCLQDFQQYIIRQQQYGTKQEPESRTAKITGRKSTITYTTPWQQTTRNASLVVAGQGIVLLVFLLLALTCRRYCRR